MDKTKHFERNAQRLPCVKVEEWEGFIFINFHLNATSLKTQLAPLSAYLKNYGLGQMKEPRPWFMNATSIGSSWLKITWSSIM